MWPVISVFAAFAVMLSAMTAFRSESNAASDNAVSSAIADNMIIYSGYVTKYAVAHPTVQQLNVADAALALPYWFVHTQYVKNYVLNGRGYVYYTGPTIPALPGVVTQQTQLALTTGVVTNGVIVSPLTGAQPTIPLPAQIPSGSVVITQ